jgi:hypothetical protein
MSDTTTVAPPAKPASEKPAAKKAPPKRRVESRGDVEDPCLAASFFALKTGSIDNAKKALQELHAQHAESLRFVIECGGYEDAIDRLDELAERLQAA